MNERASAQFCFSLLNEPPRMVVNSGSTFLKRCQQAKEMYGPDAPPETEPTGIPKEDATAVRHGLRGGPRGHSMGVADYGHFKRAGTRPEFFTGANGQCKERRSPHETNPQGMAEIRN